MLDLLPVYDGRLRVERRFSMKQSEIQKRLREYILRGNFTRDFKGLLRRARVPAKRFHDLRGTFATERYRDGFELIDLQYLMRHSSIATTARYVSKIDGRKLTQKSSRTFKKYYETKVL